MRYSTVLKGTGLLVLGYLLIISLSYSYGNSAYQPIIILLVGISLWIGMNNIRVLYKKNGAVRILFGILFLGGIIRFSWAILVPTLPFSDFLFYHESAIKLSQGTSAITKNMGYSILLSMGYRIYPIVLTGKLINATVSTLSILFLYLVGSKLVNQPTGLIAAFLFAIFPSEILMVSVLGVEVVATTLGIIIVYFIIRTTNNELNTSITSMFYAGIFFGLGLTVRSSYIFYFPAILLWIIFLPSFDSGRKWRVFVSYCVGIVIGLILILMSYYLSTKQFSFEPLRTPDSFPFLSGTNARELGIWNQDDANLYFSWPIDRRDALARQEAINRIKANPIEFVLLVPKKIAVLMGQNDYGNYWSLHAIDWGIGNIFIGLYSQSIYIIIWVFAFYAFNKDFKNSLLPIIVLVLILSTLLPHTILEVQGRYHHHIMPLIVLLASNGIHKNQNCGHEFSNLIS